MSQAQSSPSPSSQVPPSQVPPPASPRGSGFFGWIRSLGIVRDNGWIGGVCGGVGARLGIDPIVVRGIIVVVALLGGPAILFYAAAWALLPDAADRIHLERMIRGIFDPPSVAIVVLAILAFLPLVQGAWWASGPFGYLGGWSIVGRIVWSVVIIPAVVLFIVWAARGFHGTPWRGWRTTDAPRAGASAGGSAGGSAGAGDPSGSAGATGTANFAAAGAGAGTAGATNFAAAGTDAGTGGAATAGMADAPTAGMADADEGTAGAVGAAGAAGAGAAAGAAAAATTAVLGEPDRPTAPPTDASTAELDAWKERQAAWRVEHEAWKTQQAMDARALRDQRAAAARTAALERAARDDEARRLRKLTDPRTSAAYVFSAIGLAIIAGASMAAVALSNDGWSAYAAATGLASATLVFGLAVILAGLLRRRSGFLTFLSIVLLLGTLYTAFFPRNVEVRFDSHGPEITVGAPATTGPSMPAPSAVATSGGAASAVAASGGAASALATPNAAVPIDATSTYATRTDATPTLTKEEVL